MKISEKEVQERKELFACLFPLIEDVKEYENKFRKVCNECDSEELDIINVLSGILIQFKEIEEKLKEHTIKVIGDDNLYKIVKVKIC